jgi:hypothetical protein
MRTPRAALAVTAAGPMLVGIDGADSGIAAGFLEALLPHPQHNVFKLVLPGVFRWQPLEGVRVPRSCAKIWLLEIRYADSGAPV